MARLPRLYIVGCARTFGVRSSIVAFTIPSIPRWFRDATLLDLTLMFWVRVLNGIIRTTIRTLFG